MITLIMMEFSRVTDSLTINEVLTDEAIYDLDLDGDGNIGDTISAVYMNVPDADAGVEDKSDNFGLYKTATGSYIADTADLAVGDYADEPTLLIKQTVSRGKTSTSLYDFKYTPTGAVAYAEGGGSVYYQDTKGKWFRDNFSDDGVFQATDSLTLSEVRNEEAVHDLDLDGDGNVGDIIVQQFSSIFDNTFDVEYKLIDDSNKFTIDASTGELSLKSELNYSENQQFNLIVEAHTTTDEFYNKSFTIDVLADETTENSTPIVEEETEDNSPIETNVYPENETIEEPTLEPEDNIVQPYEPSSLIWGAYHDNKFYKVVRDNLTFSEAQLNANQSSFWV